MSIISDALKKLQKQRYSYPAETVKKEAESFGAVSPDGDIKSWKKAGTAVLEEEREPVLKSQMPQRASAYARMPKVEAKKPFGQIKLAAGIFFVLIILFAIVFLKDKIHIVNILPDGIGRSKPAVYQETSAVVQPTEGPEKTVAVAGLRAASAADMKEIWKKLPSLSGIMYSPVEPKAIMSGQIVGEGDIVKGFKIIKILPTSVTCSYENILYEIKLQ